LPWECDCVSCGLRGTFTAQSIAAGHGCARCGKEKSARTRRLGQAEAIAVAINVDLEPLEPYAGRDKPWQCRCLKCGRTVVARLGNMRAGNRCAFCSSRRIDNEVAIEAMLRASLEPMEPFPGSKARWPCRCQKCGALVAPSFGSIARGQGGCLSCGLVAGATKNRRDAAEAKEAMLGAGLTPLEPYPGRNKPWRCTCEKCQREVSPRLGSILSGAGSCRFCADRGSFSVTQPTDVYLLHHDGFAALKVGVANQGSLRIAGHERHGWKLIKTWPCEDGATALFIERQVLRWWRHDRLAPEAMRPSEMPQGGFTETAAVLFVGLELTLQFLESSFARTA
jgi:hypothetical protein